MSSIKDTNINSKDLAKRLFLLANITGIYENWKIYYFKIFEQGLKRTFLLRRRMNNPLILRHILKYTVNKFVFLYFPYFLTFFYHGHGTCYKFSLFFYPPHPGLLLRIPAILDRILILTFFAWFSFVYQESSVVLCSFSLLEFSKKKVIFYTFLSVK